MPHMRPIKMKSGGEAWILENGDTCPPGGICFLEVEWEFVKREARSKQSDPEEHKIFWECLLEAKKTIPGYLHMPQQISTNYVESPSKDNKFLETLSGKISQEILAMFRGKHVERAEEE